MKIYTRKVRPIWQRLVGGEASDVFSGMITLVAGAGAARLIGLFCTPFLTRMYSPQDYGVLALYTSIIAILTPIMTLRYVQAIPLPKTDRVAFSLFSLCLIMIVCGATLIALVLIFFGETILFQFNIAELAEWWWLIVVGVAGTSIYELLSLWATRKKEYNIIATTQFSQSFIGNLIKIVLGLFSLKPFGLLFGQFLAQSAGIGSYSNHFRSDFRQFKTSASFRNLKFLSSYYKDFPIFRLPSQFLMVLSVQAPLLIMAATFDKESTGQLGLAMMTLVLPFNIIGQAVSKAYYAEVAAIGRSNLPKIKRITLEVQKRLLIIGIPLTVLMTISARPLFAFTFGDKWVIAGGYAAILAPSILFQFVSSPLVQALNLTSNQSAFLYLNVIRIIGLLFLFVTLHLLNLSATTFVYILSGFLCVFYLYQSRFVFTQISRSE